MDFDPANPSAINPKSLMAITRGAARKAHAERARLERLTEIAATQPGVEDYTPDFNIAEAIKRLPRYLQPVVTLMATMVPLSEESNMWVRGAERHCSSHKHDAHGKYSIHL